MHESVSKGNMIMPENLHMSFSRPGRLQNTSPLLRTRRRFLSNVDVALSSTLYGCTSGCHSWDSLNWVSVMPP
jgi:hypothetical protein